LSLITDIITRNSLRRRACKELTYVKVVEII
jgi:hypothetical protein